MDYSKFAKMYDAKELAKSVKELENVKMCHMAHMRSMSTNLR